MEQRTVTIEHSELTARIFGSYDVNARILEKEFSVTVRNRSGEESDAILVIGEDAEAVLSLCEDFAIFLSERPNPFEAAVLRCYSASDCDKVAQMLLSRIEDIRIALRGTELAGAYDTAEVKISGRTVTMRGGVQNISK